MAKRSVPETPADDFEDLLEADETVEAEESSVDNFDDLVAEEPKPERKESEPELTPEQIRIRELEAAIAAQDVQNSGEIELTEDQRRILELEAILAEKREASVEKMQYAPAATSGEKILFHVRKDGLILFGNVWLRGQELEVVVGSREHKKLQRLGLLDIMDDEDAQMAKWGDRYLGSGAFKPRPGEKFDDEVAREDQRRGRCIPVSI